MDRYVHAVSERLEEQRRRPGVVDQDLRAACPRCGGDRRDVLHLEGLRSRRLQVDHFRVVPDQFADPGADRRVRSEEHTSELQSLMRISYAVFCLKKKKY